jgi:MoaA/NifB/PqqE/SkfB family radical SAM enzyme
MTMPRIQLGHLDNLWFQVSGTLCNIACLHCFNDSGPNVRTLGILAIEQVPYEIEAAKIGVKEMFLTGLSWPENSGQAGTPLSSMTL